VRGGTTYATGYAYDPLGHVKEVTDPAGKSTEYQFDDLGRLVKVTSPNTGNTLYAYDLAGNLTTKVEDFGGTGRTTPAGPFREIVTIVDYYDDPEMRWDCVPDQRSNLRGIVCSFFDGDCEAECINWVGGGAR